MGREARMNHNSQDGKPSELRFTPVTDIMGTRLAIGDHVYMTPNDQAMPIYAVAECKADLRPGVPAGVHILVLHSIVQVGVMPGGALPVVRVASRRDVPEEQAQAETPPSPIILPGDFTGNGKKRTPNG